MDRDQLLLTIAETGYNVGYGARKTFATFDMVGKVPGWIGFVSFAIGTFALFVDLLSAKIPSAILLIAGVATLYFNSYRTGEYEVTAKRLLELHYKLRDLYRSVKSGHDIQSARAEFESLEREYFSVTVSKQIFLSDWFAHYKFFAQSQIGWMDEQLHFTWRDKIPLSAKVAIVIAVVGVGTWFLRRGLTNLLC